VVRFDDLIADPTGDEEAEDAVFVGEANEDGEDDQVHDAFGILAVVHGADAGDQTEQSGEARVGCAGWIRRRDGACHVVVDSASVAGVVVAATCRGLGVCANGSTAGQF
jgi:hypothetical protein